MSIYPKLAASRLISIKEGTCFLLMPFLRELRSVHAAIKEVCESLNIKCERADDIYSQRPIFSTILDRILSSEVIVADLTGRNPNVFYETGIAHSFREPQSVVLISQTLDDVPFDLRHLPIVLYKTENIQKFELELEHRISNCRISTRGVTFATSYLLPLHFHSYDIKSFIDYTNEISEDFFSLLARCLQPESSEDPTLLDKGKIQNVFKTLLLVSEASNGRWKRICDHLRLEILCTERYFDITKEHCFSSLQQSKVNQYNIYDRDQDFFAAELCFKLIGRDLAKAKAINWLLEYLHNPRMGNIDIVRYKIESFMVESDDNDMNAALLSLLSTDVPSVRENVADIVGQKSLPGAGKFLTNALTVEENPYAARSIITAIARQNATEGVSQIVNWIRLHHKMWWDEPISLTLKKVAEETVRKLDPSEEALFAIQDLFSEGKSEKSE